MRPVTMVSLSRALTGRLYSFHGWGTRCSPADRYRPAHRTPQCQRSSQPSSIGNAARSNDRHMDGIDDLRDKCHRGHLAHMAAALGTFGNNGVNAERFQMFGQMAAATTGMTVIPAAFHAAMYFPGFPAPVVTSFTPSSTTILANSSACGCISMMFTPKGLSVSARQRRMFSRRVRVHAAGADQPSAPAWNRQRQTRPWRYWPCRPV